MMNPNGPIPLRRPALPLAPAVSARHEVQFYEEETFLISILAEYIAEGLNAGENVLAICTPSHRTAVEEKLMADGWGGAPDGGQCVFLDASETMSRFMVDGFPDRERFHAVAGAVIHEMTAGGSRLRLFGEMVALLWEQGNTAAALRLEQLWNEVLAQHPVRLLCAYPLSVVSSTGDAASFDQICSLHSHVAPAEGATHLRTSNDPRRAIAALQREAEALRLDREKILRQAWHLAAIVESSDDAIISKGIDGIIQSWNKAAEQVFGYTADEAIGRPILMLIPDDRRQEEAVILGRICAGERIEHYETVRRRKDGVLLDISLTISPIKDSEGRIIGASKIARNITERKRSDQALRSSRERLQVIFDQSPECIKLVGQDGTLLAMNSAGCRTVEAGELGDVVGRSIYTLIAPEYREAFREMHEGVCRGEKRELVFEIIGLKGTRKIMETRAAPIEAPDGNGRLQLSVTRDITLRRRTEEELKSAHRHLAEQVAGLTRLHDLSTRLLSTRELHPMLLSILKSLAEMHGAELGLLSLGDESGEFLTIGASLNFPETALARLARVPAGAGACGRAFAERRRMIVQDTETDPSFEGFRDLAREAGFRSAHSTPILARDGRALGVMSVHFPMPHVPTPVQIQLSDMYARQAADFIEQVRISEALLRSEALFRKLCDFMPQIVWAARPDGYIDYYNRRWYEFVGAMQPDADASWSPVLHPDDVQRCQRSWEAALRSGQPYEIEYRFREHSAGLYRWFLGRALPIRDESGKVIRWFGTCTDIEEQKRSEETLEQKVQDRTESLKKAIAQLEEFSYTVSHDLRTPLRSIQAYSTALIEDFAQTLPPEAMSHLERIHKSVGRLDQMIRDVLTYSRMARAEMVLRRVSLGSFVRDIVQAYPAIQEPRAEIAIDELHDVLAHEPSLTQAISNILGNAVKFVRPGVQPRVRIWSERRANTVRVWIEDNGIGINPRYQHRLFNMFERINPDAPYEGTGVGLAIVRKAVERMGGAVGMESDGVSGSRFWLELNAPAARDTDSR